MKSKEGTTWQILAVIGAFALALALRMIHLGAFPLRDVEARTALQALAMARGEETLFGPHSALAGLTSLNFLIFTSSNFIARFWTAFFGSLIVVVPFLFRKQLGWWVAAITSFVLAVAPDMVGLSRAIGSPIIPLVCLLLGLGFFLHRRPILSGIFLALALMSGPDFWLGGVILLVSSLVASKLFSLSELFPVSPLETPKRFFSRFGFSLGMTLLVVGTGFFMAPAGLSGILSGLVHFIKGFAGPYTTPYFLLPLAILTYAGAAIPLSIWGALRGILNQSKFDLFLVVWWMVGLILIMLYPGNRPENILWVSLPMWILSVRVLYYAWQRPDENRLVMVGTAVLVVVLSAFMLLALRSLVNPSIGQDLKVNYLIALAGGAVLIIAIVLLVNFGWSEQVAMAGLLMGVVIVASAWMISNSVNSTSLNGERSAELWFPEEPDLTTTWLTQSIDQVVLWNKTGNSPEMLAVLGMESPGMQWALRDYPAVTYLDFIPTTIQPGMVITTDEENLGLVSGYRGQVLVWSSKVLWQEMKAYDYLFWLVVRNAPTLDENLIFWVRTDLMPDSQFGLTD
jgi:hypothetical protein